MNAQQDDLFSGVPTRRLLNPGRVRKLNGQFKAASKRGRDGSLWLPLALNRLRGYLQTIRSNIGNSEFTFEQFRAHAEQSMWPAPASVNAWGALPAQAAKAGLCEWTGRVTEARRPSSRARLIKVWRAL